MPWEVVAEQQIERHISREAFDHVIEIWWQKPHTVNRKLCGCVATENLPDGQLQHRSIADIKAHTSKDTTAIAYRKLILKSGEESSAYECRVKGVSDYILYPIFDEKLGDVTVHPSVPYRFEFVECQARNICSISLSVGTSESQVSLDNFGHEKSIAWLKQMLFPRIVRWLKNCEGQLTIRQTLRLVDLEQYNSKYQELKRTYAKNLCKSWPETTDPQKFVYEDIAIAAYLLVLWEKQRNARRLGRLQTFVDIGCGNGLLVYLLCAEGHEGYGMDLRRRKIWDCYDRPTKLVEKKFIPSDENLFPDIDWLIGNHSDELTPWLPVIAFKSSATCQYFVIPCCPFDFHGKFQRTGGRDTIYRSYLNYVEKVGGVCGFRCYEDVLKIPSTKRTCIVGFRKVLSSDELAKTAYNISAVVEQSRQLYLKSRYKQADVEVTTVSEQISMESSSESSATSGEAKESASVPIVSWTDNFVPREKVEAVRNCTKIPRTVLDSVVNKIAQKLLALAHTEQLANSAKDAFNTWNCGGSLPIKDCMALLDDSEIVHLKMQFGGMQTLLRNHQHIFEVQNGSVRLCNLLEPTTKNNTKRFKTASKKTCWFFINHPQSCPLFDNCPLAHCGKYTPQHACPPVMNWLSLTLN